MHFKDSYDISRDHYFNKNGWVVIRFAEEQIVKQPESCITFIAKVVDDMLESEFVKRTSEALNLTTVAEWTYAEAEKMAANFYRESYLGISFAIDTSLFGRLRDTFTT